ncbi:hypothetical protein K470DRAFT_259945 [Piedraia hortae CBS 480.64]|uniref:Uncharacterized protein n=1 Tax=Piedraia hortae CBS 480.64 TaxID=1314780 RepID=A0A6A7BTJ5_9PEZI|nr:hypothetical protein K470DRAFT_259945 [Piedraia hortae CBS 480.64]
MNKLQSILRQLGDTPAYFPDCCAGISLPLIATLCAQLPPNPQLTLSIGSGSGLLEALLLAIGDGRANIFGVEVPSCENLYMPVERMLIVPTSHSVNSDAVMASALLFVYPRHVQLVKDYLGICKSGALEQVVWLGPTSDWVDFERVLRMFFHVVRIVQDCVAEGDILGLAASPRR